MTYCTHCAPELFDRPLPIQRPPNPPDEFERPTIRDRRQIDIEEAIARQKRQPPVADTNRSFLEFDE